ncbi:MAG: hypothetical protein KDD55_05080, partial [Bdellovibrionales bacterium]|nr:hypothetical protein [Bdellovibrionales bacterium]
METDLHPMLSGLPMGLVVSCVILEILVLLRRDLAPKLSFVLQVNLLLLLLFGVVAFLSGYGASGYTDKAFLAAEDAVAWHHSMGRSFLFVLIPCVACRFAAAYGTQNKSLFRGLYYFFLVVVVGFVAYTGFLGGD